MAIDPVIAEILFKQGEMSARLDAVEAYICKEREEDSKEVESEGGGEEMSDGPELATNPALYSNQLEFDLPPIF